MKKLTVHEIFQLKGKRQLTEIYTDKPEEAAAAAEAGIEMIVTISRFAKEIRKAAPEVFLVSAPYPFAPFYPSDEAAIRTGQEEMDAGADAVYCGCHNLDRVAAMASVHIPVIGHVGYIPYLRHWIGGPRSFGKTAPEALQIFKRVKDYEAAGAIGVEMELVPHRVATEISKRTKICVISMGSGNGCDAQYLFATDILGTNKGHVPRHAKQYANLAPEYERLQKIMTGAFAKFKDDVATGAYPEAQHNLEISQPDLDKFIAGLES
jgi:3-methyl-2-oxobutanoate hydroxymethyltransferase